MNIPPICITHEYLLGDTVLIEAIAAYLASLDIEVYVQSSYPEVFENNPDVVGVNYDYVFDESVRIIDLSPAVQGLVKINDKIEIVPNKLEKMAELAGVQKYYLDSPRIFLSSEELELAKNLKHQFPGKRLGIALKSDTEVKNWHHMAKFIKRQTAKDQHVFVFTETMNSYLEEAMHYSVIPIYDTGLREVMAYISAMDVMFGIDTGLMHIAGALNVSIVVVLLAWFKELYDLYDNATFIKVPMSVGGMDVCGVWRADRKLRHYKKPIQKKSDTYALALLEGLGGTATISDHARKLHAITSSPVDLVIRSHRDLFKDNPYVGNIIEIGMVDYSECERYMAAKYNNYAIIKTGIGKWYGEVPSGITPNFSPFEKLYEQHPLGLCELEKYCKHLVQTADMSLGLPDSEIKMNIFYTESIDYQLPDEYIVVSNGVDTWHKGLKQTKSWEHEYWCELTGIIDLPIVQIGTNYDIPIDGAINMLGRTTIPEMLGVMEGARAIICTEGGLMHLGVALGHKSVIVMAGPTRGNFYVYHDVIQINSPVCKACYWKRGDWYRHCRENIDAACMKTITPARVAWHIMEALNV